MGLKRKEWLKEYGATLASILSVLLSAAIVYSSNASLKEKYEIDQQIERQRITAKYHKWWLKEFSHYVADYVAALDAMRMDNIRKSFCVRKKIIRSSGELNRLAEVSSNRDRRIQVARIKLLCLLDLDKKNQFELWNKLENDYNKALIEFRKAEKGELSSKNISPEFQYQEHIQKIVNAVLKDIAVLKCSPS